MDMVVVPERVVCRLRGLRRGKKSVSELESASGLDDSYTAWVAFPQTTSFTKVDLKMWKPATRQITGTNDGELWIHFKR